MTMKQFLAGTVISLAGLGMASADTLGFRVGGGVWQPDVSGTFRHGGGDIDLDTDLNLQDGENQSYVYAFFEHPVPLIPNLKISQTSLEVDGAGTASFTFGTTNYTAATTTKLILDHSDTTLYYSILDNWINLDLGLTAKTFDGKMTISDGTTTETTNIDKTIPLLYGAIGVELPFVENLFFGMETNVLSIGDHKIQDYTAKISYTSDMFIGFEVGVRTLTVKLDNLNGNTSDMEFSGSFANVYLHF